MAAQLKMALSNTLASWSILPSSIRTKILCLAGVLVGRNATVMSGVFMKRPDRVYIGDNSFVGYRSMFDGEGQISIGRDCMIAAGCSFFTTTHEIGPSSRRGGAPKVADILVGNGCWIGANVTVLPGVKIGEGCVIGAGSVVTKSVPSNALVAGVPARVRRELDF